MAEARRPRVYSVPAHRAFADALAGGLIRRFGGDRMRLARGLILLPNQRSKRAVTDAFVRVSGGALLLPRIAAIGDPDLGEGVDAVFDPADEALPPAVAPLQRRMILARLVSEARSGAGRAIDAAEAVRLAGELARTLDQLSVEGVAAADLRDLALTPELSAHWEQAIELFGIVVDRWPVELARLAQIDGTTRRIALVDRLAARWRDLPPAGFVCAAGVTDSAPAVARLLRCVSELPEGMVVLAGVSATMPGEEWDALGPHAPDPATGRIRRSIETHPQYHLKLLLERMGVARDEVESWRGGGPGGGEHDATAARGRAIANALAPAAYTGKWTTLASEDRRLAGVVAAEFASPADEAQGIAMALREAIETPGRTAALVTPDRALARRVAAHCARWGIEIDDSAGRALSILPPGMLLLDIVEAAAQAFAPLPLMALLKHPLVRSGAERLAWLDGVRLMDRALRGPRPAPGLAGIDAHLADAPERERRVRAAAQGWWPQARDVLAGLDAGMREGAGSLAAMVACLREAATALAGDAAWSGPAGRVAAELLADLEVEAAHGPRDVSIATLAALLRTLMDEVAVRSPQGGHPRLAIYGQIEARLQTADLMILGGLNEGTWPGIPAPDPWLAPRVRAELGLPGLERRIGVAAHDFGQALGAPRALLTRSRREGRSPALASRFWLRLEAMAGERFERARDLEGWVRAIDAPGIHAPADRPAPVPHAALRPTAISVTEGDRWKADPYAFYARRVLKLMPLDPVDADPTAAWRGTAVHGVLEEWAKDHDCAPDALLPLAQAMLEDPGTHPLLRALWEPRLVQAIAWIAQTTADHAAAGRSVAAAEGHGAIDIAGVRLSGRFDRVDTLADGGLAIIDYKTGKAPSVAAVREGFSLQLGLLGAIIEGGGVEGGGFDGLRGAARGFEYWSLARKGDAFGQVSTPVDDEGAKERIVTGRFVELARENFAQAAGRWLTGDEAFVAKLVPEYAPYAEYDQLMRRDEWYGRDR